MIQGRGRPYALGAYEGDNYHFPTMRPLYVLFLAAALVFAAGNPTLARQDDTRLDRLFETLQSTADAREAQIAEARIWELWFESGRSDIDDLLSRGGEAMNRRAFGEALERFNEVIEKDPDLAEGWNRRATLHFLMGNYKASIADIEATLALEPRHFGALSGLGLVNIRLENFSAAIKAFEKALEVNPHMPGAKQNILLLRRRGGQDI